MKKEIGSKILNFLASSSGFHSGSMIARKLKISRTAISEKIRKLALKELGDSLTVDFKSIEKSVNARQAENLANLPKAEAERKNQKLRMFLNRIRGESSLALNYRKQIAKYNVEIQKKYSIPFACIMFVLVGAPLGVMTRRGGITVAAVLSIIFFLIYYIFLIGGEELADAMVISPFWAMWTPDILMFLVGIYLVRYASSEQHIIDFSRLSRLWRRSEKNKLNPSNITLGEN
jgi:lipopolysaccharide export system permease protein